MVHFVLAKHRCCDSCRTWFTTSGRLKGDFNSSMFACAASKMLIGSSKTACRSRPRETYEVPTLRPPVSPEYGPRLHATGLRFSEHRDQDTYPTQRPHVPHPVAVNLPPCSGKPAFGSHRETSSHLEWRLLCLMCPPCDTKASSPRTTGDERPASRAASTPRPCLRTSSSRWCPSSTPEAHGNAHRSARESFPSRGNLTGHSMPCAVLVN